MNLEIHARGIEMTESLRELIERRVLVGLDRFASRVQRVRVQLTDLNGPRGGVDIRCKIEASLGAAGAVVVHETRETPFSAVSEAGDAVKRAVRRRIKRLRMRRRAARRPIEPS
ncbi:MAG: HPF/RaiA family ribosome-associated protein [Planctomycetota bacterium]